MDGSIIIPEPALRVIASPNPFEPDVQETEIPAGGTLLEIMRAAGCGGAFLGHAHVWITNREMTAEPVYILRENWHRVRPKPGMVISVRVVPAGGGGGGKSPLRTVLTIAVIVGSIVAAAYAPQFWSLGTINGKEIFLSSILAGAGTPLIGPTLINVTRPPRRMS